MLKTVSTQLALASDTLPEVLSKGNTTGGTDLAVSTGDDVIFADNSKAIFGDGSDLSIYSDGSTGQVTGNVNVTGAATFSSTVAGAFNGTLGATTPASVAATTGTFSGVVTTTGFTNSGAGAAGGITANRTDGAGFLNLHSANGIDGVTIGSTGAEGFQLYVNTNTASLLALSVLSTGAATFSGAITATGGVYLGGTGAANLLDDYEEGTWTPVPDVGTFSSATGTYTKIGNLVTLTFAIVVGTGGGTTITAPIASSITASNALGETRGQTFPAGTTSPNVLIGAGGAVTYFRASGSGVGFSPMTLTAGAEITGNLTYTA